jgi:hypothetical protein
MNEPVRAPDRKGRRTVVGISDVTIKRLFAVSNNICAFPDCPAPLVEGETFVGEVCHIKSASKGHPRYDPIQSEAERHGFDNLLVLCRKHHKIIDTEVDHYPPEALVEMKKAHEAQETRRFTISDALVQRLGELLAADAETTVRPTAAPAYPDWGIRGLFFHIRPDLIDDPDKKRWESVRRQVMDHFSTGRLSVWGRPLAGTQRGSLKRMEEPSFWDHARFTYWFLKDDGAQNSHVASAGFPDYADLKVNRAEALAIWPVSGEPQDDRPEVTLLDAARQAYSETRNDPVAPFAEAFGNTPEEILTWYCTWLGQHMKIYGARRPSTKIEPVSIDNPTKDFDITDRALTLRERNGSAVYENLRVKLDELPAVIQELKGLGKE